MTLYELTEEYQYLSELLQDDSVDPEVINDTLEALEGELEFKADSYAKIIKEFEGDIEKLKAEINRLKSKRQTLENSISRLKKNLFDCMVATDKKKFKTDLFSFNIQKNGGQKPLILDVEVNDLPDELVVKEPNMKAIRELGDSKYAHFGEVGESLRIR